MNNKRLIVIAVLVSFAVMACAATEKASTREITRISKDELKANLDNDSYVIIDVRIPKDYDNSDVKIKGAIRENPMDVNFWTPYPKDKTIVLYCA